MITLEKPRQYRGKLKKDIIDLHRWVYGYYMVFPTGEHYIYSDGWHEVIPETVGQYIGFNDNVGNALYEGDICEIPNWTPAIHYVTFNRGGFCFGYEQNPAYLADIKYLEISVKIGNIFDNPELLKHFQNDKTKI